MPVLLPHAMRLRLMYKHRGWVLREYMCTTNANVSLLQFANSTLGTQLKVSVME